MKSVVLSYGLTHTHPLFVTKRLNPRNWQMFGIMIAAAAGHSHSIPVAALVVPQP